MEFKSFEICIIDDDDEICQLLEMALGGISNNHQLVEFETHNDSEAALEELGSKKFDLILVDYMMPSLSGDEIIENVRNTEGPNQDTPFFVISGKVDQLMGTADLSVYQDVEIIEKPPNFDDLRSLASRFLGLGNQNITPEAV